MPPRRSGSGSRYWIVSSGDASSAPGATTRPSRLMRVARSDSRSTLGGRTSSSASAPRRPSRPGCPGRSENATVMVPRITGAVSGLVSRSAPVRMSPATGATWAISSAPCSTAWGAPGALAASAPMSTSSDRQRQAHLEHERILALARHRPALERAPAALRVDTVGFAVPEGPDRIEGHPPDGSGLTWCLIASSSGSPIDVIEADRPPGAQREIARPAALVANALASAIAASPAGLAGEVDAVPRGRRTRRRGTTSASPQPD